LAITQWNGGQWNCGKRLSTANAHHRIRVNSGLVPPKVR
jgi:hypothetical protein